MTILAFGINETPRLGEGWHEREPWGGGRAYRNTSERAFVPLDPAWAGRPVAVLLSPNATGADGRMTLTLRVGGRTLARIEARDDRWRLVEATLPATLEDGDALELAAEPVSVPDRVLHNGDRRRLGARVAAIRFG